MKARRSTGPIQFRLVAHHETVETQEGRRLEGAGYRICDTTSGKPLGDDDFFFRIGGGIVCDLSDPEVDFLQDEEFAPGHTLQLVRRRGIVEVRDRAGEKTVGRLPGDVAEAIAFSETHTYNAALCLWEWRAESGRRFALRLLLAPGWSAAPI